MLQTEAAASHTKGSHEGQSCIIRAQADAQVSFFSFPLIYTARTLILPPHSIPTSSRRSLSAPRSPSRPISFPCLEISFPSARFSRQDRPVSAFGAVRRRAATQEEAAFPAVMPRGCPLRSCRTAGTTGQSARPRDTTRGFPHRQAGRQALAAVDARRALGSSAGTAMLRKRKLVRNLDSCLCPSALGA